MHLLLTRQRQLHNFGVVGDNPSGRAEWGADRCNIPAEALSLAAWYSDQSLGARNRIMWDINDNFEAKTIEVALPAAGFSVGSTRGVARVEKYGCGAEFRRTAEGTYQMTIPPSIILGGKFTRLWDAGYQKFLLTDDGRKFPAVAKQLSNLRRFNEELRTVIGVPTYYNDALGSTSQVSVYDRVKGRTGAVPDESVGAKAPAQDH